MDDQQEMENDTVQHNICGRTIKERTLPILRESGRKGESGPWLGIALKEQEPNTRWRKARFPCRTLMGGLETE